MTYIIFGFPMVFWSGLLVFLSFLFQMYLGYRLTHGYAEKFKIHKINSIILTSLIFVHLSFGILLYFAK